MKKIAGIIFIFFLNLAGSYLFSQENNQELKWKLMASYSCDSTSVWSVDWIGNVIIQSENRLSKFDSIGNLSYSQSIKSIGNVKKISPINTMKIALFSEEQQTLCILDNTLTLSQACLDLSDFDVQFATCFAPSSQQEKIWVFDQLGNRIQLLSLNNTLQYQEIKNLKGILNTSEIVSIKEFGNELFVLDDEGKLFQFDLYGSVLNTFDCGNPSDFIVKNHSLYTVESNKLTITNIQTGAHLEMPLPINGVTDMEISGSFYFLKTVDKILKYELFY